MSVSQGSKGESIDCLVHLGRDNEKLDWLKLQIIFRSVQDGVCQTSEILTNEVETQALSKSDAMVSSTGLGLVVLKLV